MIKIRRNKILKYVYLIGLTFSLSSCASSYKTTWECPKVKGIGCSSVEYADHVAREQILLNKMVLKAKKNQTIEKDNSSYIPTNDCDSAKIEVLE